MMNRLARYSHHVRCLLVVASCCVLGCLVLPLDQPLASWCLAGGLPGDIRAIFGRAEPFGHGYGVLFIAVTIHALDPARRRDLPRLAGAFIASGLLADAIKLQVWRFRPRYYDARVHDGTFVGTLWTRSDWNM